jgi:hypothetical protein
MIFMEHLNLNIDELKHKSVNEQRVAVYNELKTLINQDPDSYKIEYKPSFIDENFPDLVLLEKHKIARIFILDSWKQVFSMQMFLTELNTK